MEQLDGLEGVGGVTLEEAKTLKPGDRVTVRRIANGVVDHRGCWYGKCEQDWFVGVMIEPGESLMSGGYYPENVERRKDEC